MTRATQPLQEVSGVVTTPLFWIYNCHDRWLRPKKDLVCTDCGSLKAQHADADVAWVLKHTEWLDEESVAQVKDALIADPDSTRLVLAEWLNRLGRCDPAALEGRLYVLTGDDLAEVLAEQIATSCLDAVEVIENAESIAKYVQTFLTLDYREEMTRLAKYACSRDPDNHRAFI